MNKKIKILVDGNCIVCDLEVSHYKRVAPDLIEIVDISDPLFKASSFGLTPESVNKHLHVIDSQGQVHKGVDAFSKIWSTIPKYLWAHKLIDKKPLNAVAKIGYKAFVMIRPYLPKKSNRFFFF